MAGRIRSIKPELLDDEPAAALSDAAWRLWVSSWVLADDHGRFRAGAKYLAANVWQNTNRHEDAEAALAELVAARFIRLYQVEGQRYAEIKPDGWKRHQRIDHPGRPRVPVPNDSDYLHANPRGASADTPRLSDDATRVAESLGPRARARDLVGGRRSEVVGPATDLCPVDPDSAPAERAAAPSSPAPHPGSEPEQQPLLELQPAQPRAKLPRKRKAAAASEEALGIAWRTWRAAYHAKYHREYPPHSSDGPAMVRAIRAATEFLGRVGRPATDLEALVVHRWRRYLGDSGRIQGAGVKGFLDERCHPLECFERNVAVYGSPWDREQRAAMSHGPQKPRTDIAPVADPPPPDPEILRRALSQLQQPGTENTGAIVTRPGSRTESAA